MSSQPASLVAPLYGAGTPARAIGQNVRSAGQSVKNASQNVKNAGQKAKKLGQRLRSFLQEAFGEFDSHAGKLSLSDLINAESAIGATIFGPIPAGHRREFFHHNNNVWIWHESWQEGDIPRETTIRYEVRPDGVYKRPLGGSYTKLTGTELENFRKAVHTYLLLIKQRLY